MKTTTTVILTTLLSFTSLAVALEPQLYPNEKAKRASTATLRADISACKNQASAYIGDETGKGARAGLKTAAKGAAVGALAGAVTGQNVGRATGAGAAAGGLIGTTKGVKSKGENNPDYQRYVNVCLEEKGYKVVGWK